MWKSFKEGGIFAKNSDRSCNEPNLVQFIPGGETKEETVMCTYISVPQVKKKHSVLLVRPSWMWGAEMGINELGVIIGNEAVFTKSKGKKTNRLLGMDILRLALERADNAKEGLDEIISALTTYGQGGNCGFDKKFYYDNSFLVADRHDAYIIETSGYEYKTKKLGNYGNISNRLSIEEDDFAKIHTNKLITYFAGSMKRQISGCNNIQNAENIRDVFAALRAHDTDDRQKLYTKGSVSSVCMHQSLLGDHTTGSMVVDSRGVSYS
jgi:dipeptidase